MSDLSPTPDFNSMRCSDADRVAAADVLNDAFADGRLEVDEHLERVDAVWRAKTMDELEALTADLGGLPAALTGRQPSRIQDRSRGALMTTEDASNDRTHSIMSTTDRNGSWIVPRHLSCFVLMGETKYDMREALFSSMDVTIDVASTMGSVKIWVPDGVTVRDDTTKIMAETKMKGLTPADPRAPMIIIKGFQLMSDLQIFGSEHKSWWKKITGK